MPCYIVTETNWPMKQNKEGWIGGRRRDSGVEGLELTSSHKNSKITTNWWTTINKIDWKLSKKIPYAPKQRRSHTEIVGGAISWYKQPHTCQVGSPQTGKKLYHRDSPTGVSSEPQVRSPHLGIWYREKEPPEHLALKASGTCAQELHRTVRNKDLILERYTQSFMYTRSQGKAETPQESGSDLTVVLGGSPGKMGVTMAHFVERPWR